MASFKPENSIRIHFDFDKETLPTLSERKALQARMCQSIEEVYKLFGINDLEIGDIIDRESGYEIELSTASIDQNKAAQINQIIEAAVRMVIDGEC